ncbi:MAG: helix-turn-helix domain-containing protein [Muribaculaceae bacterium]|nr:helix-turn-helix domain-containing protein [Muribaculaceae bacterium]
MYRTLLSLVVVMVWWLAGAAAEPYCIVTTYSDREGVPASTGSRTVQDHNDVMWMSTWNGLYRFDGYEFRPIRPAVDNDVRKYSSRFRDIKPGPDGKLWCRIDDNIVLFDVDTYEYTDIHSQIEEKLGENIRIENAIRETTDGDMVLTTSDSRLLVFDAQKLITGESPASSLKVLTKDDPIKLKTAGFHKAPLPKSLDRNDVAYTTKDNTGNLWCVTKDGRIMTGHNPEDTFKVIATVDTKGSPIKYSCEDSQGHVWIISQAGIHKIDFGTSPFTYLTAPEPSQLRASMIDNQKRIWMSWSDSEYVTVSDTADGSLSYLKPDGTLSQTAVRFGSPIYSIATNPQGHIWLGSKPDGLFRLIPRHEGSGYTVEHFTKEELNPTSSDNDTRRYDNYYDMAFDSKGRLWLATLGNGIEVMEQPSSPNPRIIPLIERKTYPYQADKARRIRIIGDSIIVATTTEGLLSFPRPNDIRKDNIKFRLHRSAPGDELALGNIATMDAIAGSDGRLYVATESDGINILTSPLSACDDARWDFSGVKSSHPAISETALTLGLLPDGRILVVGKKEINLLQPSGKGDIEVLGASFWKRNLDFREVMPLKMNDGRWLIGLNDGAVAVDFSNDIAHDHDFPVTFTSYNIEGGQSMPLSPKTETITLQPNERSMTLTFAALCYSDASTVSYAYRSDDNEEWIPLGKLRTLTFTRLEPGKHKISVRSTDITGRWLDNGRTITIDVKPTFWETGWAKLLYVLAILSVTATITWAIIYMRRIKRKQRETLEAYLSLLEARTAAAYETKTESKNEQEDETYAKSMPETEKEPEPEIDVKISSEDKVLISRVVDFIDRNFADSGITVDDIATAVAVSKSSLTRKMKSLMGVTPADFLKTTRLSKAKIMLKETDSPIKEIAIDCGFSDMNYFGKCFKAAYGVTPGNFRKGD